MTKFLTVLGVVVLTVAIVLGAFVGCAIYAGAKSDASSKEYVDRVVPEIVGTWSAKKVKQESSSELSERVTDSQIIAAFRQFSTLGRVAYRGSQGESKISFTPKNGRVITAKYKARAKFERGDAMINIGLVQRDGRK